MDLFTTEAARLYLRMRVAAEQLMGDGGHSSGRRSLLRGLARHGPKTVSQMARERPVARQHFQRLVNGLRDDGLVELRPNPAHKRSPLVALTDRGEGLVDGMEKREGGLWRWLAREMTVQEIRQATSVVRRVKARLESGEWQRLVERSKRQAPITGA